MTKLGTYPSNRITKAWMTQRLINRAPEEEHIRKNHASYGQQIFNPAGIELQETTQKLTEQRFNQFLNSADLQQLDTLYKAELSQNMSFTYTEDAVGQRTYTPPTVYAM